MIAIKNVLVATDFSEASVAAVDYAREIVRRYQAVLHVVHVVDDIRWRYALDGTAVDMGAVQESLDENAAQQMAALVTDTDRSELKAKTALMTSTSVADAIVDYADRQHIDLIVIGTHGRSGLRRFVMGSVAERVVRLAPCPVLTVRGQEHAATPAAAEGAA